jgi:4-diphosphocytidyl-2-C-methyl-D-erythritol kinase
VPVLLAPAKLNLTLEVLARRPDGYHGIRSLMVPIALFDRITVEPASDGSFACDVPELEHDNTIPRALLAAGCTPAKVRLEKRIPAGAGLGGGSSDAAAILLAAMEGTIARSGEPPDWLRVARAIGSDVPFFLAGTGALVEGTGERVTAIGALPPWWCVVLAPAASVSTAEAYRLLDARRAGTQPPSRPRNDSVTLRALEALQRADFGALCAHLANDFESVVAAEFPFVAAAKAALQAAGAHHAHVTGTGSCVFALFASEPDARAVAERAGRSPVARSFVVPLHSGERWRRTVSAR